MRIITGIIVAAAITFGGCVLIDDTPLTVVCEIYDETYTFDAPGNSDVIFARDGFSIVQYDFYDNVVFEQDTYFPAGADCFVEND